MSDQKYSKQDILERVDIEGLEYAFLDWFSVDGLKDYPELVNLVRTFQNARSEIEGILKMWEEETGYGKEEDDDIDEEESEE
jgi:hypothetical protein